MNEQSENRTWLLIGILVTVIGGLAAIVIIAVAVFIFNATAAPNVATPTAVSVEMTDTPAATEEPTQPLIRTRAPTGQPDGQPTALPLPSTGGSSSGGSAGGGSTFVESPQQSVAIYYRDITAGNYDSTWEQLTDDFKQEFNCCAPEYDYEGYLGWWTTVDRVDFGDVRLVERSGNTALVYAELIYTMEDGGQFEDSDPYIELEYSSEQGRWQFADKRDSR